MQTGILSGRKLKDNMFICFTLLPTLVVVLFSCFIPVVQSVYMSFFNYILSSVGNYFWNNFQNYREIFTEGELWPSVAITLEYVFIVVALQLALGMLLALILNRNIIGRKLMRSLILIPWIYPTVITALLWSWLFHSEYGVINYILVQAHILQKPVSWLGSVGLALPSIIVTSIWKQLPLMIIMLLAGLQSIPIEMYEAAVIDGAKSFQIFRHITMPFLRNVIRTTVLMSIILNFKQFPLFWIMTGGGPVNATSTLAIYSYRNAFVNLNLGKGAAVASIWLLILLLTYFIFDKVFKVNEIE
ncbi:MAG TPA: sugar ABC transporter permease [Firmicutes bacterium]|jgi:multiple sugar transport system permease protein|nr:sugar ABC transporter permease [Bacillota bacterium]